MTATSRTHPNIAEQLRTLYATHPICIEAANHIAALECALEEIKSWRNDTFGSEEGEEFNSGARVALYRCADRAIVALEAKEPKMNIPDQGDLVETLLNQSFKGQEGMRAEAAKEIVRLRNRIAALEVALRKIQKEVYTDGLLTKAARTADAALQPKEPSEDETDASGAPHSGIPRFSPVSATAESLADMVKAIEDGTVRIDSPNIGGGDPEIGYEPHYWHEEWLHYAKQALGHAPTARDPETVAKIFAFIWHGDAGEWRGFLSKAEAFVTFPFDSVAGTSTGRPAFYGAQCPSYPNCTGGCGLGCTHEIEQAAARGNK